MKFKLSPLYFLLAILFLSISCDSKKEVPVFNRSYSSYINSFTSGVISKKSSIRISLAQNITQQLTDGILTFEPELQGELKWNDNQSIEFIPSTDLVPGEVYVVHLALDKLMEVPDSLSSFDFGFQVIHTNFEWGTVQLKTISKNQMQWYSLQGTVLAADDEDLETVEKLLEVQTDNRQLSPTWTKDQKTKIYSFVLDSLERRETAIDVLIKVNQSVSGPNLKDKTQNLPGLKDFKFMGYDLQNGAARSIILNFSDPIKSDQSLKGLITLEGVGDVKYKIDNTSVILYPPDHLFGDKKLQIFKGIKNILDYGFEKNEELLIKLRNEKPQVQLIGNGNILPSGDQLLLPFKAISLDAVDVKIIKVPETRMLQFLQNNDIGGSSELYRVGEVVAQKKIDLTTADKPLTTDWTTYSLDLSKMIEPERGAIYRVYISFKKEYAHFICEENLDQTPNDDYDNEYYYWDEYDEYEYYGRSAYNTSDYSFSYPAGFRWNKRQDPCHVSYYNNEHFVVRNILASDLGLIAKRGNDNILDLTLTNLKTTNPISGAKIYLYNYQQRLISTHQTDSKGWLKIETKEPYYFVVAEKDGQKAYLIIDEARSVSVSNFPVFGERVQKGIKGFIYADRGVWRPGDTVHLNFILEDGLGKLPSDHPVHFELYNPNGALVDHQVSTNADNFIRSFKAVTKPSDVTGNYEARIRVGSVNFSKRLKIETVKPNRLDVELEFDDEVMLLDNGKAKGTIKVKWLTGVDASNSKVTITATVGNDWQPFPKHKGFTFKDPSRQYQSQEIDFYNGTMDENGVADFNQRLGSFNYAPGMLKARFLVKAFEGGGDFSTEYFETKVSPFKSYVGMKMPRPSKGQWYLTTGVDHKIDVKTVDHLGNNLDVEGLEVKVYKIGNSWWYNHRNGLSQYINNESTYLIEKGTVSTKNGSGHYNLNIKYPNWGRYLVRITGKDGHATGQMIYIDWPQEQRRGRAATQGGSTELNFRTDKEEYEVGDDIVAQIPMGKNSRVLVTLENGSGIIKKEWLESDEAIAEYRVKATPEMSPNMYISAFLIQPHAQTENDRPIRLYGIVPVTVKDPETKLHPIIKSKDKWRPETEVEVEVEEKDGKEMYYTLAIVDEGLLNLTGFKTPKPWPVFNAKEALGIRTWDVYRHVIGAFSGEMSQIFAVGGDEALSKKGLNNQNRFVPMVRHLGPFKLEANKKHKHKVKLPNYVGKVKVMVVAANKQRGYGSADKSIIVSKPLMVLTSLPRLVSPKEQITLPVTVFAMEDEVREVTVELKVSGKIKIVGDKTKVVKFSKNGEKVVDFKLETPAEIGTATIIVNAKSGKEKAHDDTELMVRIPNPPMTYSQEVYLKTGQDTTISYKPIGVNTTNRLVIESYGIPPINLEKRLKYLTGYPHGCAEQTISRVYPLLYLESIMDLSDEFKQVNNTNIGIAIKKLNELQYSDGGIKYWSRNSYVNTWVTSYAGQFLNEAKDKGYDIPQGMIKRWEDFQKQRARSWRPRYNVQKTYCYNCLDQAYRLYTLAEVGKPEIGAMNRIKEEKLLSNVSKWNLSGAYLFAGQDKVARELAYEAKGNLSNSQTRYSYYGSNLRNKAMELEVLYKLGDDAEAFKVARQISKDLTSHRWYTTHSVAFALKAMMRVYGNQKKDDKMAWSFSTSADETHKYIDAKTVERYQINNGRDGSMEITLKNTGDKDLNFSVTSSGIPIEHNVPAISHNLTMTVVYKLPNGKVIDVNQLKQGQDFFAEVYIRKVAGTIGCEDMALSQLFPAGWEIINTRLLGLQELDKSYAVPVYQDIRDDRVYTYFNLAHRNSVKFKVRLNATYAGKYYLPPVYVEDMYNIETKAQNQGQWVEIIR